MVSIVWSNEREASSSPGTHPDQGPKFTSTCCPYNAKKQEISILKVTALCNDEKNEDDTLSAFAASTDDMTW